MTYEISKQIRIYNNEDEWDYVLMTKPEILKLAETCGIGANKYKICICWEEELLKFALLIHENGYNKGYDDSKSSSFKGFHNCLDD